MIKFLKKFLLYLFLTCFFLFIILIISFNWPNSYSPILSAKFNINKADSVIIPYNKFINQAIFKKISNDSNYVNTQLYSKTSLLFTEKFIKRAIVSHDSLEISSQTYSFILLKKDTLKLNLNSLNANYTLYLSLDLNLNINNVKVMLNGSELKNNTFFELFGLKEYAFNYQTNSQKNELQIINMNSKDLIICNPFITQEVNRNPRRLTWIVLDALRNDIINNKMILIAPTLNKLADENDYFSNAHSPSNGTFRSTLAFLTGKNVEDLSLRVDYTNLENLKLDQKFYNKSAPNNAAFTMMQNGFLPLAFVNNPFMSEDELAYEFGFPFTLDYNNHDLDHPLLAEAMLSYLNAHPKLDMLLFINPNTCHHRYRSDFIGYIKSFLTIPLSIPNSHYMYYGAANVGDNLVSYLCEEFKKNDLYDEMKMIIHSDHGEHLHNDLDFYPNDREKKTKNLQHSIFLPLEVSYVPLIFKGFTIKQDRNSHVNLIDIMPTLAKTYHFSDSTYSSRSLTLNTTNRNYHLFGNRMIASINNNSYYYDAVKDEIIKFDSINRYQTKTISKYYKPYYIKNRLRFVNKTASIKRLIYIDSNATTVNISSADFIKNENHFKIYKINSFPIEFNCKISLKSLKEQKKFGKKLIINDSLFIKLLINNSINLNDRYAVYTKIKLLDEYESDAEDQISDKMRDQLRAWGYIK